MGNQHSASHAVLKPRKNVHWKSAGRPAVPGKPAIIPISSEDEPNAITLRWAAASHDGGTPLQGYQVECNRLGSADWIRTAPPVVLRPELVLTGLEPPHRYQFRVAALNAVGQSEYSELSDVLIVSSDRGQNEPPIFLQHLEDVTALENEKTEFRVTFTGSPAPTIAWFKDDYEIFSSRRTAITTNESSSVLVFHQTLASDEGEIKCTATNRAGHAVSRARLALEAAPKLRYPRQYEDGLLYEINETVFLKTTIVGKPTPTVEWRHNGQTLVSNDRVEITNTPKFAMLKIHTARRNDRGEYQIHARNMIGEDTAAFLVTITAPPDPPRRVSVARQVDKSVTLDWEPPEDDGGCRIGNYIVEYFRAGWNVWLKATTSRKTNVTLFDLIEGSEYRFRVKAESPYGMSEPSEESVPIKIPGRAVDMEFLAVESRIISEVLTREDGEEIRVSPVPRRKRANVQTSQPSFESTQPEAKVRAVMQRSVSTPPRDHGGSNEIMIVLYPDNKKSSDKTEKRKSFQLELEDALSPPPISLSAPELSTRCVFPFKPLRCAVSSTELLHERAMARFYKAVEMKEQQTKYNTAPNPEQNHIPYSRNELEPNEHKKAPNTIDEVPTNHKAPIIFIKTDSVENREYKYNSRQTSQDSEASDNKWQHMSFDEDYTASTVSEDEYSDEESSLHEEKGVYTNEEDTYNPRDKQARPSPLQETADEEEDVSEKEPIKPIPVPDPNFIPKPILKRREQNTDNNSTTIPNNNANGNFNEQSKSEPKPEIKPKKKEEKMTIFKKFTKMPVQKPFPFPKILNKKEPGKQKLIANEKETIKPAPKEEKVKDNISDEGKTVIDYYGNIVKEFGRREKPTTQLYLKTEDLKSVAEKQIQEKKEKATAVQKKANLTKKTAVNKPNTKQLSNSKAKTMNSIEKPNKSKTIAEKNVKNKLETNENPKSLKPLENTGSEDKPKNKCTQQIVLKTTERATIVIPIDYEELEEKAKINVRSVIDYMVDMCLLLLAFWVYFFKDERLAIPFLILIIYRQIQETLMLNIPEWVDSHTPSWLKKKNS